MNKTLLGLIAASSLALASSGIAGGPSTYQVTGPVLDVSDTVIAVQKGKDRWEIARTPDTKVTGDLKVGAKVTITYTMTAATVDVKLRQGRRQRRCHPESIRFPRRQVSPRLLSPRKLKLTKKPRPIASHDGGVFSRLAILSAAALQSAQPPHPQKGTEQMLHIIWSIIVGFIIGLIARFIMPGANHMGFLETSLVGIVGSVVGGFIARLFSKPKEGQPIHPAGLIMSVIGALVVLFIMGKLGIG